MKIESALFFFLLGFLAVVGTIYLWWSGVDVSGGVPLVFGAGLGLVIGFYLWLTGRRFETPRPEDMPDGEIEDGAGELGFFSPHSWWPLVLAAGPAILLLGVVFGLWLLLIGLAVSAAGVVGMVLEYSTDEA